MLAAGCAMAGAARGDWPGPGLPPDMDEEVLEEGAEAEASRAVAEVWAVASGVQEVGARLSFTFWSERGALTLTGYTATGRGGPQAGGWMALPRVEHWIRSYEASPSSAQAWRR
jgi:hypothetical protein